MSTQRLMIRRRCTAGRSGVVLLAVLMVIVLASLVGTTVLIVADANRAGAEVSLHRTQSRALAWSGVQAVMAQLASQREELLDGKRPRLMEEWAVTEEAGGPIRGVFRLIPLADEGLVTSESAKLDLNTATAEALANLPGLTPELAARIVAARESAPVTSVEALLTIEGITPEVFYGPVDDSEGGGFGSGEPALADFVTVFSFDPNVQVGLGDGGEGHRGELRLNLNTPWSARLERALARRFDQEFADGVKGIMDNRKFEHDSDMVAVLNSFNVEPKDWIQTLDVFTTSPDPYLLGRVDINTASEEVLSCIPGIDGAAAGRIVGMRGRLEAEALRSVAWPAIEGVLTPEQFQQAVDHMTTRSMQWRVRVEAGFETVDDGFRAGTFDEIAPKLRDRIVLEAVVDVSSERPRIAYLRDITGLDAARAEFARSSRPVAPEMESENRGAVAVDATDETSAGAEGPSTPSRMGRVSSRIEAAEGQRDDRVRRDASGAMDEPERAVASPPAVPESTPGGADKSEAGLDRRIGRWTPAGGSQGGRR